ncbi:Sodium/calcium exchanger 1 [Larimichthys crocea]|uniref:Uncharacterized protein n=1 Tax=Larimichthys crocea TaxID=215358 RepID=A0ACD3Q4P6_LARCR|nr:Sodium/calcium exchanger 1 [Larimichthys crocea]
MRRRDSNENKPLVGAEEEEVAKMGCPSLGEHTQVEVVIEESYEFKMKRSEIIFLACLIIVFSKTRDDDEEESGEERLPSCFDYIMHFLTVFWKVLFAFVPPTEYWNGWACFIVSISLIGVLTAVTGDLASHFGCTIGLKDSVTAVVFVALGTSVPDTFASKVAAIQDQYADASIGNVTGSNAVNVFLGIGVAWTIAAGCLALQGPEVQGGPRKPGFLRHPLHHPGRGVCGHAAVPATGVGGRWRIGRATDLQALPQGAGQKLDRRDGIRAGVF